MIPHLTTVLTGPLRAPETRTRGSSGHFAEPERSTPREHLQQ
jgi:hypothetical protein